MRGGGGLFVVQVAASVAPGDGGPTAVVLNTDRELRAIGVRSLVVTTDADGASGRLSLPLGRPVDVDGALVLASRVHAPRRLKTSLGLLWTLLRQVPRADAVHVHGLYLFSSWAASVVGALFRTPVFVQPHGVLEPYQRRQSRRVKAAYDRLGGAWALRNAAGVVFTSPSEAEHAADLVPAAKAHVVPLGATVRPVPDDYVPSWQDRVPQDRPFVLFLGRVAAKKRVDLLVAAWPRVLKEKDATLVIAGGYEPSDRRRWEPNGPTPEVVWLGHVAGLDRDALLRRAALFVLPSENENFAIAVAESLVAGTPVVVTREVAMAEVVERTGSGVVLEGLPTPEQLAVVITDVLAAEESQHQQGQAGGALVGPELTWQAVARRLVDVYSPDALSGRLRRTGPA